MLNKVQITERNLITNAREGALRASSYDVGIGTVLCHRSDKVEETTSAYRLKPQEMVVVISKETVTLPMTIAGYAMPVTRLAREGILALSTGIIDPGYDGPLSSVLVNFGRKAFALKTDHPFLRLTFHGVTATKGLEAPPAQDLEAYKQERKGEVEELPQTFLDIPNNVSAIAQQVAGFQLSKIANILAIFAVTVAIYTLIGAPLLADVLPTQENIENDILGELRGEDLHRLSLADQDTAQRLNQLDQQMDNRLDEFRERLDKIEAEQP